MNNKKDNTFKFIIAGLALIIICSLMSINSYITINSTMTYLNKQITEINEKISSLEERGIDINTQQLEESDVIEETPILENVEEESTDIYEVYYDESICLDTNKVSNITIQQLNDLVGLVLAENKISNSILPDITQSILDTEMEYNVNAIYILAVISRSSNYGTSYEAKEYNNLYRFKSRDGNYIKYESYSDALNMFGQMMNTVYFNKGIITIKDISNVYVPGNSESWEHGITSTINTFYNYLVQN